MPASSRQPQARGQRVRPSHATSNRHAWLAYYGIDIRLPYGRRADSLVGRLKPAIWATRHDHGRINRFSGQDLRSRSIATLRPCAQDRRSAGYATTGNHRQSGKSMLHFEGRGIGTDNPSASRVATLRIATFNEIANAVFDRCSAVRPRHPLSSLFFRADGPARDGGLQGRLEPEGAARDE